MKFPRMIRVRQRFEGPRVDDVAATVTDQLRRLRLDEKVRPGDRVAIPVGSRGIANLVTIVRALVDHFKKLDAEPFLVPAMGSHGGATAEGQRAVLEHYGVTEETVGAPIRSTMETVVVAETPQGVPVHFDKYAYEADHVFVWGRVKPHTCFTGEIESGLHKMMLIGLGKHAGAEVYHRAILDFPFMEIIEAVGRVVLEKCHVVGGLAVVENAYDETALIEAVPPDRFLEREKQLLGLARQWMPRLPFPIVDLLIVDEIGKNISGTGMDTNVIGRKYNYHAATERDSASCKLIFVRGLTPESQGNAAGLGMADITNDRTVAQVDRRKTAINALTAKRTPAAALPISLPTDRECIEAMLLCIGWIEPQQARVIQIANTLRLAEVLVSEAYQSDLRQRPDLEVLDGPNEMQFDEEGNLQPVLAR
ncbi:MAG: DUF2088 domain-containing protein [Planctomycetes bacterium]|nr:DUF2088 domain-containing protein [Planctomycetota bacterium]